MPRTSSLVGISTVGAATIVSLATAKPLVNLSGTLADARGAADH
jgi:hypothetical protein